MTTSTTNKEYSRAMAHALKRSEPTMSEAAHQVPRPMMGTNFSLDSTAQLSAARLRSSEAAKIMRKNRVKSRRMIEKQILAALKR